VFADAQRLHFGCYAFLIYTDSFWTGGSTKSDAVIPYSCVGLFAAHAFFAPFVTCSFSILNTDLPFSVLLCLCNVLQAAIDVAFVDRADIKVTMAYQTIQIVLLLMIQRSGYYFNKGMHCKKWPCKLQWHLYPNRSYGMPIPGFSLFGCALLYKATLSSFGGSTCNPFLTAPFLHKTCLQAYIGPPSVAARFDILRSSVLELCRVGIVHGRYARYVHVCLWACHVILGRYEECVCVSMWVRHTSVLHQAW